MSNCRYDEMKYEEMYKGTILAIELAERVGLARMRPNILMELS